MDRNSPDFYTASCADNLADSLQFIKAVRSELALYELSEVEMQKPMLSSNACAFLCFIECKRPIFAF